jgi:zinc protease
MRRRAAAALAFLVASTATGVASPLPVRIEDKPLHFDVPQPQRSVLLNGVVVYLLEDHTVPAFEVTAVFSAGTGDDPASLGGLAEVTAEAIRSGGAGERDAASFEQALANLAARLEYRCTPDLTRFSVWSLRSSQGQALDLFVDLLRRPRLSATAVRTAIERRAEEARREDDDPETVARREFTRRLYAGQGYGNWPTPESIARISRGAVRDFYRRYYQPRGLMLTVAGDFDGAAMLEALGSRFGDWKPAPERAAGESRAAQAAPGPASTVASGGTQARDDGIVVIPREFAQTSLIFGHPGPRWADPDLPALEVLSQILTYYRYFRDVRDNRGLAYEVYSYFDARRRGGAFVAAAGTRGDATRETLDLMRHHLEEIAAGRFTDEEAKGSRDTVVAGFAGRFATAADTVNEFATAELHGLPPDWLPNYARRVAALTPADLRSAARRHLHPRDLLVVVVGDPKQVGSGTAP